MVNFSRVSGSRLLVECSRRFTDQTNLLHGPSPNDVDDAIWCHNSEGLHAADDEIWCQKKDCMLQMIKYGVRRRIAAADDEIWCQKKDCMLQMIKYGVRRRDARCR